MYEFFVSYSRHDAEFARAISESLSLLGVPAWIAESEILVEGRKRLEDRIILHDLLAEAAMASHRCMVLLSPRALKSKWVMDVEVPPFLKRERDQRSQLVWPMLVGPDARAIPDPWTAALPGRTVVECRDLTDVDSTVREVCSAAGVIVPIREQTIQLSSSRTVSSRLTVTTEQRRFAFALDIGTEWIPRSPVGRGMLLNIVNGETDLRLNLIVGAMPPDFGRKTGTEHVEDANYFAEPFVTRRFDFRSQFRQAFRARNTLRGQWSRWLLESVKLKLRTATTGRQEVLGSHVVNVWGQPHFAYTYRVKPRLGAAMIARKYSVILAPPGAGSDRYFEFVFTAGFAGGYEEFIKRIPQAESIVRSFRFAD